MVHLTVRIPSLRDRLSWRTGPKHNKSYLVISSRNSHFTRGLGDDHAPGLTVLNALENHLSVHTLHIVDRGAANFSVPPVSADHLLPKINPEKLWDPISALL